MAREAGSVAELLIGGTAPRLCAAAGDPPAASPGVRGNPPVTRVRKAYEQVYDQLRDLIVSGELPLGERLPGEIALARQFGVSRGTVREALRALAAHGLLRTEKGASGGSFVTLPSVDHISGSLQTNIGLLSEANDVTLEEFLEVRRLMEVFAARQCALRCANSDLERLRRTVAQPAGVAIRQHSVVHDDFHRAVLDGAGNTLLRIAAQPIFSLLQTKLAQDAISPRFAERVDRDHRAILAAIERGDADAAAAEMDRHLSYLGRTYMTLRQAFAPTGHGRAHPAYERGRPPDPGRAQDSDARGASVGARQAMPSAGL
jgi:DNA-binding FadR family transcriptional regulator